MRRVEPRPGHWVNSRKKTLMQHRDLLRQVGKAPMGRVVERSSETPITDEVEAMYDPSKERIKEANYWLDLQISKLKGCL